MSNTYTAVTKESEGWWIGWIEEIPGVNCQERTHEELIETLRITLSEMLESNREDALRAAAPDSTGTQMYSVDVHPDVYAELEHSRTWYEKRADGLGTEFLIEFERAGVTSPAVVSNSARVAENRKTATRNASVISENSSAIASVDRRVTEVARDLSRGLLGTIHRNRTNRWQERA